MGKYIPDIGVERIWVEVPLPAASAGEIVVEKTREVVTGYSGARKEILALIEEHRGKENDC